MYFAGESNVPGAPGNLNPGGLLAGGIPVGQDPRLPMSQADFQHHMGLEKLNRILGPAQEQRGLQRFREIMGGGVQGAFVPGATGTPMGNAGFFAGPQLGQMEPVGGFQRKTLS
jgi:hypothetical protein